MLLSVNVMSARDVGKLRPQWPGGRSGGAETVRACRGYDGQDGEVGWQGKGEGSGGVEGDVREKGEGEGWREM